MFEPGLRGEPVVHIEDDHPASQCHVREIIAIKIGTATDTSASMRVDDARSTCGASKELRDLRSRL